MQTITILKTVSLATAVIAMGATPNFARAESGAVHGDYVEARTASVFAGACHYNGELTTAGRDAEIVWHVRDGVSHSVNLAGLTAVAAITADENLKDPSVARRTVLYICDGASDAQLKALAGLLIETSQGSLGKVVAVKRTPISFSRTGTSFSMRAKGVGSLDVSAMPNAECCKQPNLVWYKPFFEISDRKVGFTRESGIQDGTLGVSWTKLNQNTAFYGTFALGK